MKAIKTKYIGPTNVKGSRVSAIAEGGNRIVVSWDSSLNSDENHKIAARMLCEKMNWKGTLCMGGFSDCNVHTFVKPWTTYHVNSLNRKAA